MSATITSSYVTYIDQLKDCRAACESCLATTSYEEACHFSLRQCSAALRDAIQRMESGRDASRALVDCADVCERTADRCDNTTHPQVIQTVRICRTCVDICRQASLA